MFDLSAILGPQQKLKLTFLLFGMVIAAALEMIGIASIPVFVSLLIESEHLIVKLPAWGWAVRILKQDTVSVTLYFAGALAVFFLLKNAYLAGILFLEGRILQQITVTNATRLFQSGLFGPYITHLQRKPAEHIRNISDGVADAVEYLRSVMLLLREVLVCTVVVALLILIDPMVSLSVFALLGVVATIFHLTVRRSLAARGERSQFHYARQLQVMSESLASVKVLRLLGREPQAVNRFRRETRELWRHEYFYRFTASLPRLFLEAAAVCGILFVVVLFVLLQRDVNTVLPVLALLVVAVVRMIPALNAIGVSLSSMQYYRESLSVVARELRSEFARPVEREQIGSVLSQEIRLCDIQFRYPGAASATLKGLSLTMAAGEAVGIAGPTGSGKSTLVDIILGLIDPCKGVVRVDGTDIQDDLQAWQRQIGYVPQDVFLLDDSIRRNVAFGIADHEINEANVAAAIDAAQLASFLDTLPDGLDTMVGDRGIRLSGGQRQRIGIARALYLNPGVLVMDEATSALDSETESAVIAAIARLRGERTIIIIAHRLSTLSGCDRILHLRDGLLLG